MAIVDMRSARQVHGVLHTAPVKACPKDKAMHGHMSMSQAICLKPMQG